MGKEGVGGVIWRYGSFVAMEEIFYLSISSDNHGLMF